MQRLNERASMAPAADDCPPFFGARRDFARVAAPLYGRRRRYAAAC
ncbi:hypothetical protein BURMUCGD1_5473 [Burkholderia multivorans CGD1]|nr:hypothetical protein BURMUCGD1_5473 [Burkholderia multivorans CGD1]